MENNTTEYNITEDIIKRREYQKCREENPIYKNQYK